MASDVLSLLCGYLITGVEDEEGGVRVYLGARHEGIHTHLNDPSSIAAIKSAWADVSTHVHTRVPTEALCDCKEETDADA